MKLFRKKSYDSFIAWSKTLDRRVSSAALILEDAHGQALIVKASYKSYWTFPGGIIDKNETPKEAAIRETHEEVGVKVKPEAVEFVAVINRRSETAQTYQFIFKAALTDTMRQMIKIDKSEIESYAFVEKSSIQNREKVYGKVIEHWAHGSVGYVEQMFSSQKNG